MSILVLPMTENDIKSAARVEALCFSLPWNEKMLRSELSLPGSVYFCAFLDGNHAGYGGMRAILDEGHITNIAVYPDMRKAGVGSALIQAVFNSAALLGLSFLTLEVRESNLPAISLYKKFGFEKQGLRKNYYERPVENALIMTRFLRETD